MLWTVRQYGDVVHRFRDRECHHDAWDEVLISLAILIERGPQLAGTRIAKKLRGGGGIWELLAHHDNLQPRLLFYRRDSEAATLVFVHAFMKKGNSDYVPAIRLAKERRSTVERGRQRIQPIDRRSDRHVH